VVAASQEQHKRLNTNTRYLDETIVKYAQNLTDTLPPGLDICFFTNSGSESNDLALRLARHFTGSKETIVLDAAYHGHLSSLIEISPYKHCGPGGSGTPDFVNTVPRPDPFRGKYRGTDCSGNYVQEIQQAITTIQNQDLELSAFIAETIMGCGGQLFIPEGFLKDAFALVRKAGGVCILDEVQIGFGRIGSHFWGFESHGVVPDILTMGKLMGNGHPLSAVVTTREIADTFNNGMEYFNSFAGNPVSCAVGQSVLDVIRDEELQANSLHVGAYLLDKLRALQVKHELIGDVRGAGLFIGVELVNNNEALDPASDEAYSIINRMKEKRLLLSIDGPDHNVIKIKPPLIFTEDDADFLSKILDESLSQIG
jgi:4-aminobutyrate aminotransferase-like enzyme